MSTSNLESPKKSKGSASIKFLIAVFSLSNILVMWNLFANKSFDNGIMSFVNLLNPGAQAPANTALNDPPLPALDPLPDVIQLKEINLAAESAPVQAVKPVVSQPEGSNIETVANLRSVSAPSVIDSIVQKVTPKVDMIEAYSASAASSGGGGGGGGGKKGKSKSS